MSFANKSCDVHPTRRALSFCQCCREFFCEHCLTEAGDYYYCAKPACVTASREAIIAKKDTIKAQYAQWFCDDCVATTEETPGGKTFVTMNGIGAMLFGKKARCPRCGSVQAGAWLCILFIPVFRIGQYRVI